jgi:DNA-binding response OmpR family regulator
VGTVVEMQTRSARPSPESEGEPPDESYQPSPLRVLIADDEPEVQEILISVVDADPGLELAGVAADAEKAVEVARVTRPDVALLDVSMPGGGGVRAALGIGWRSPQTHMVAPSLHEDRATLTARPGVVFTRQKLLELVWGPDWFGDDHVVDDHVSSLRRKIGDDRPSPRFIQTVRAVGYRIGDGS